MSGKMWLDSVSITPDRCAYHLKNSEGREADVMSYHCDGNMDRVDINRLGPKGLSSPNQAIADVQEVKQTINDFFAAEPDAEYAEIWQALKGALGIPLGERKAKSSPAIQGQNHDYDFFGGELLILELSFEDHPVNIRVRPEGRYASLNQADPSFCGLVELLRGAEIDNTQNK